MTIHLANMVRAKSDATKKPWDFEEGVVAYCGAAQGDLGAGEAICFELLFTTCDKCRENRKKYLAAVTNAAIDAVLGKEKP